MPRILFRLSISIIVAIILRSTVDVTKLWHTTVSITIHDEMEMSNVPSLCLDTFTAGALQGVIIAMWLRNHGITDNKFTWTAFCYGNWCIFELSATTACKQICEANGHRMHVSGKLIGIVVHRKPLIELDLLNEHNCLFCCSTFSNESYFDWSILRKLKISTKSLLVGTFCYLFLFVPNFSFRRNFTKYFEFYIISSNVQHPFNRSLRKKLAHLSANQYFDSD